MKRVVMVLATMIVMPGLASAQDTVSTDVVQPAEVAQNEVAQTAVEQEKAADTSTSSSVNMAQTVKDSQSNKAARKEAMRNLSAAYPENSEAVPAPAPVAEANVQETPAKYVPPSFKTTERLPRFEHHGYFRTRLNYFGNYDLDTRGTSPVGVPLNADQRGSDAQENIEMGDADAHLSGNIRFRYQPTIHITESVRISGTFDVMDNLTLGTSPNGLRENWGANVFFTFDGADAVKGDSLLSDAISIKALYGEADTILGTFRVGRVPTHWGMGLVYNDGGVYKRDQQITEGHAWKCLDCDGGDAVDKVEWRIRDPFYDMLYLAFSWDFINSGLSSYKQDSMAQAFDLAESDDVLQFTLSIFDRPISQQEIDTRYRKMFETREWTADWGILYSYREQNQAPEVNAALQDDGAAATYLLYEKSAKAHVFDLWGRFYIPLPKEVMLRLEAEFVGVAGSVKLDLNDEGDKRDILQFGLGFEGEVWWRDLVTGIKTGFAWADNMKFSGHSMIENYNLGVVPMGSILRFDPSYRIDDIMFHELMDGINNAWYLNIYGEYKFPLELSQMTMALGARLDLSTAAALVKDATPGDSSWYGFEADLKLFYEESDRFRFEIGAGVFVPGNAWQHKPASDYPILPSQSVYKDSTSDTYDPEVAWNVIANLYFMF
ncbi:MAG: hypothetical protein IIY06_04565 [Proteobacteria bacterium]|nr:hypothetical protein [Pseudomonadota bacterium]